MIDHFSNLDIDNIVTPINVQALEDLLVRTHYDRKETAFLIKGFSKGFSLGYKGPKNRQDYSKNIPFTPGVGNKSDMWNKIMKEVKLKRFAGPFSRVSFEEFIQSPIGLVPKAGGQTRLIFHLSYKFPNGNESINHWTPKERCTVSYRDIDHAIKNCLSHAEQVDVKKDNDKSTKGGSLVFNCLFFGKTDLRSAYRVAPMKVKHFCFLVLKAEDPTTGVFMFFIDKCMPFGASISCAHFQRISNALKHIVESLEGIYNSITNYLDDFLFVHYIKMLCRQLMRLFYENL